ncbi:MAG TPA: GNAT family N-acetyltransferase [Chloroflexia bacterium]|nr:GNAT family N-acetyltransferase [Chloroflexia bacterium]
MEVEYRKMRLADEDAVFDLRMRTWGAPSIEYVRQGARLDPLYLDHTLVAFAADGTLLSTVRYWLRQVRDATGVPQQVGCVASVTTIESARRQGHARKLMQLAIESMRQEGCAWTLLMSSDMGVPLYEGLGYRVFSAPYYRGVLSDERPQNDSICSIETERIEPPFDFEEGTWKTVRDIYALYNARRPLALVRDEAYWRGYFSRRIRSRNTTHPMLLIMAYTGEGDDKEYAGYLVVDYSTQEVAREEFNLDQFFTIGEIGVAPGHEEAIPALTSALADNAAQGHVGGRSFLPREPQIDAAMRALFGQSLQMPDDRDMMALPLEEGCGHEELEAMFAAPGALFWIVDDF